MSLEEWSRIANWLREAETTVAEIQQLLQVVDRDLADSQVTVLSDDNRFQHAYNAALQLCMLALRASGYTVPKGQNLHKRAIESLGHTLGSRWKGTVDYLERCSRQRGQNMYERVGVVSKKDVDELVGVVRQLRADVLDWLKETHSGLVPPGP